MNAPAAFITGSSRGIGKGIALALAEQGFSIALNAPQAMDELDRAVEEIAAKGVNVTAVIGDVSHLDRHETMLDEAENAIGPITTFVNNAGVSVLNRGDLLEVTPHSYDRCQSVNTRAVFFLTQAWARRVVPRPRRGDQHHCVITVSSSNSQAASVARGEYCISKAATSMITRLFAVRLSADDIGAYEIQPGLIATDMTLAVQDEYQNRISEGLTLTQRMGTPNDIGSIAAVMATGKIAFCTGQAVQADGGLLIPRF